MTKFLISTFLTAFLYTIIKANDVPRIINGSTAVENQFPWHAYYLRLPERTYVCGGSLISKIHILTAAHCLHNKPEEYLVYLGSIKRTSEVASRYQYQTNDFIIHHGYDSQDYLNDIAILILPEPATITEGIAPIALPRQMVITDREKATIIGFGKTQDAKLSEDLKFAHITILGIEKCKLISYYDPNIQLCSAGSIEEPAGVCFGDSGGSMVVYRNEEPVIIGIASFVTQTLIDKILGRCPNTENYPSYFTRVSGFLRWIDKIISVKAK